MFGSLLFLHSLFRWLLLLALITSVITAYVGYRRRLRFSGGMNALRHWTATVAHIQLVIGIVLWTQSSWVKAFLRTKLQAPGDAVFFGLLHLTGMLTAIVLLTIGSAKAKREKDDHAKFRTTFNWYLVALLLILALIPWPFSPLASRPFFRAA